MKYTNKTKSGERKNRVVYDSKNNYYIIDNTYVLSCLKNAFNGKKSYWLSKKYCTLAVYCFSSDNCFSVEEQLKNIDGYITMSEDIRSKQEGSVTDNVGCVKLYYDAGCEDVCFVHFDKTKISIDDIQKTVGKCHEENLSTEKIISCLKEKFKNDIKIEEYLDTICI